MSPISDNGTAGEWHAVDGDRAPELLEAVVATVADGLYQLDPEGRFVAFNGAFLAIVDRSPDELLGRPASILLNDDDAVAFERETRELLASDREAVGTREVAFLRPNGEAVPCEIRFRRLSVDCDSAGTVGVVRDVSDRKRRERELRAEKAFTESILDAQPDVLYAFDPNGRFLRWNRRATEVTGYTDEEIADMHPLDVIPEEDRAEILTAIEYTLRTGESLLPESAIVTASGERIPYEFSGSRITDDDGTVLGLTGIARDVSERKAYEEELRRQRDELARLDRINSVIRRINRALVGASSREQVERTVCEQIALSEPYVFAWIGDSRSGDRPALDSLDAVASDVRRSLAAALERDESRALIERAAETGEMCVDRTPAEAGDLPAVESADQSAESVDRSPAGSGPTAAGDERATPRGGGDPTPPERDDRREGGSDDEIRAIAAVPLRYRGASYGVLVLYATDEDAFAEPERAVLEELAEVIALTINGLESKRLLHADTVLELEFSITDTDAFFVRLSAELDCRFTLHSVVERSDGRLLMYVSQEGGDPEATLDRAADSDQVASVRLVNRTDDGAAFEFVFSEDAAAAQALSERGGRIRYGVADRGEGKIVVDVSPDADVRSFLERVQSVYPEARLSAKRERENPKPIGDVIDRGLWELLTERQRASLESAYFTGFFEWPRESTGEEVAASLGVSSATFHQHLRAAERKIFGALFADEAVLDE